MAARITGRNGKLQAAPYPVPSRIRAGMLLFFGTPLD